MIDKAMWYLFTHSGITNSKPIPINDSIKPTITIMNVIIETGTARDKVRDKYRNDDGKMVWHRVPAKSHSIELISAIEKDKIEETQLTAFKDRLPATQTINPDATYIPLGRAYFREYVVFKSPVFFLDRIDRGMSHPGFLIQATLALKSYIQNYDKRTEATQYDPGFDIGCHNTTGASIAYTGSGWKKLKSGDKYTKLFDMTQRNVQVTCTQACMLRVVFVLCRNVPGRRWAPRRLQASMMAMS